MSEKVVITFLPRKEWLKRLLKGIQAIESVLFRRAEVRQRAHGFLQGLLAPVECKNGWQMAEELGERGLRGVRRLLSEADWDEEGVRDGLRAYAIEHLGEEDGALVVVRPCGTRISHPSGWVHRSRVDKPATYVR